MLLEIEKILFDNLEELALLSRVLPPEKATEMLDSLRRSHPQVDIAPFDELVFGSSLPVHLSRQCSDLGSFIKPEFFASKISSKITEKLEGSVNVFLGEETFINFKCEPSYLKKLYHSYFETLSASAYFQMLSERLSEVRNHYPKSDLNTLFLEALKERQLSLPKNFIDLPDEKKTLFKLHFISDQDAELDCLKYEIAFDGIVENLKNPNFVPQNNFRSHNIHTKTASLRQMDQLESNVSEFLALFPFHFVNSLKQGQEKLVYGPFVKMIKQIIGVWNNPYLRERLGGQMAITGQPRDRILFKKSILWIFELRQAYLSFNLDKDIVS